MASGNMFNGFSREEVDSIYAGSADRFVVSFIVGYSEEDLAFAGINTPQAAAHHALELTRDDGCDGTLWFVYDRVTKQQHRFEQSDIERLVYGEEAQCPKCGMSLPVGDFESGCDCAFCGFDLSELWTDEEVG